MNNEEKKTVSFEEFKKQAKVEDFKRGLKEGFDKYVVKPVTGVVKWGAENPMAAISILTITAGVAKKGFSYSKTRAEDNRREKDFYDPRTGRHTKARRKPTRKQRLEIDRRYANKESYETILSDMGLW